MPKLSSLFLCSLYLVAMLRPAEPVLDYLINYDYISKVLCINKDKPKLNCNGKCYLMRQLKKQQDSETPKNRIQLENYPIGFIEILQLSPQNFIVEEKSFQSHYFNFYSYLADLSFFHPPSV